MLFPARSIFSVFLWLPPSFCFLRVNLSWHPHVFTCFSLLFFWASRNIFYNEPTCTDFPFNWLIWFIYWGLTLQCDNGYEQCRRVEQWIILPPWGFFNVHWNLNMQLPRFNVPLWRMAHVSNVYHPKDCLLESRVDPKQKISPCNRVVPTTGTIRMQELQVTHVRGLLMRDKQCFHLIHGVKTYKESMKMPNKRYFRIKILYSPNACHLRAAATLLRWLKNRITCWQYELGWIGCDSQPFLWLISARTSTRKGAGARKL